MTTTPDRHALLKSRLRLAKTFCKKAHDAWKSWIAEYNIDDFGDTDEIRDKVRIGYVFRKIESDQPAIFDDQPDLFIKGRHPLPPEVTALVEGLYDFLWDVQSLEERIEELGPYFDLLGMGFIESPWVTKNKQVPQDIQVPLTDQNGQPVIDPTTGQPQMQTQQQNYEVPIIDHPVASVDDPFKYWFSPETKFSLVLDQEHCPYYFKEMVMTPEEVEAKYGKKVESSESLKLDDTAADLEVGESTDVVKDDLKRVTVYEYYGSLPQEYAKGIKSKDGQDTPWEYDKEYHLLITPKEEILAEQCNYPSKPLFCIGNYGMANKFWKFGEAKHLMPLVQELQIYRSQILNHTRKMANPRPLIPDAANVDENAFRSPKVGEPVKFSGQVPPSYLSPAPLGREVGVGVEMARVDLEKTSASFDLNNGSGQSEVKTPRGIQVYAEAADKGVRRKRKKIARLIRQLIMFQFQLVSKYWKPDDNKTLAVTVGQGTPETVTITQEALEVIGGVNQMYQLDIETESLSINRVQMRQDALDLWDLASQSPDIFNRVELAKYLLQNGFSMKDGDRFILTDQQRQQINQPKTDPPKVNVSIKADAATPSGAQLLESEGLVAPGQAQQAAQATQVQQLDAQMTQNTHKSLMGGQSPQTQMGGAPNAA